MQSRRGLRGEFLPVDEREIGAVLVLKHILAILNKNARVHARNAAFFAAMRGQVYIGEDVAHRVFATDRNIVFAAQVKFLVISFDDQTRRQRWRGRRWRSSHRGGGVGSLCWSSRCCWRCFAEHTAAVGTERLACRTYGAAGRTYLAASIRGGSRRGLLRDRYGRGACQWLATFITEGRSIGIIMA